jgi:hypothetical protein
MTTLNLFLRLREVLPSDPLLVGDVATDHGDGTATVLFPGAGVARLRNPQAIAAGARVFVQGGAITGEAPDLPSVLIEI